MSNCNALGASWPEDMWFGQFRVIPGRRELLANGRRVELGSRAFDILMCLIEARGALLSKQDLISRVWGKTIVGENTLQSQISALRRALGDQRDLVLTLSGRGYRFSGQLQLCAEGESGFRACFANGMQCVHADEFTVEPRTATRELTNLPRPLSFLVGRSADVAELCALIGRHRLVTLTGTGGIGKTRLALESARCLLSEFSDGVWLAELAAISDPQAIGATIATAAGLRLGAAPLTVDCLAAALREKCLLLLVENCEHVIEAAAQLIKGLLDSTASVRILATTREPLGIPGEQVYQVSPLRCSPEPAHGIEAVLAHDAARLFCARLQEARHDFRPDDAHAAAIAAICRRLDGLPLAIELAASRAAALGIARVAADLDRPLELLSHGRRTSPMRHRTLRATLEWSYELLSEAERFVLRRLSIFRDGFSLEEACAQVGRSVVSGNTVVDCLARLISKSFVVADWKSQTVRYRLLQTTRAYVLERLAQSGDSEAVRRMHAVYCAELLSASEAVQ